MLERRLHRAAFMGCEEEADVTVGMVLAGGDELAADGIERQLAEHDELTSSLHRADEVGFLLDDARRGVDPMRDDGHLLGMVFGVREHGVPVDAVHRERDRRRLERKRVVLGGFFEWRTGARRNVAFAGAVDDDTSEDSLTAGGALDDDAANAISVLDDVDDHRMQEQANSVLPHHVEDQEPPPIRIDEGEGPCGPLARRRVGHCVAVFEQPRVRFTEEAVDDLLAVVVENVRVGEAGWARGGHLAAQDAQPLDEDRFGAAARCRDRRRDAGRSAAADDDVECSVDVH